MTLGELLEALEGWDHDLEVKLRVGAPADEEDGWIEIDEGTMLQITDTRSITMEYGDLVIIGDEIE